MIINQINSLNKKIKAFKKKGIDEHSEYVKNMISDDMGKFTKNDTLSKSKKFYSEKGFSANRDIKEKDWNRIDFAKDHVIEVVMDYGNLQYTVEDDKYVITPKPGVVQ